MKKSRVQSILVLLAALSPTAAFAQTPSASPTLWRELEATPLLRQRVAVPAGGQLTIAALPSVAGVDPVVHLIDQDTGAELAFNDDPDTGVGLDANLSWRNAGSSTRACVIVVRAFRSPFGGSARVTVTLDGRTLLSQQVTVAGTLLPLPAGGAYVYETALQPSGAGATMLLGLRDDGHLVASNEAGGVGQASRMPYRPGLTRVFVGSLGPSGATRVYANPVTDDPDGDGLGSALERELGLCDGVRTCESRTFNPADTDRDGLDDGAEVFGIDGTHSIQLPRWGANPRHKDVFVEFDWFTGFSYPSGANASVFARRVQSLFSSGASTDLGNPDGRAGVSLHFDMGVSATDASDTTLFGDWGGSTLDVPTNLSRGDAREAYMIAARRGVFRYALMRNSGAGQAGGDTLQIGWSAGMASNATRIAHELGHTVNLKHYGADAFGRTNCNPLYASIMSYAWSYEESGGFSASGFDALSVNPAHVSERDALPAGFNADLLSGAPFRFTVDGRSVDWNRDGVISDGLIRSPISWTQRDHTCPTHSMNSPRNDLGHDIQPLAFGTFVPGTPPSTTVDSGPAIYGAPEMVYARDRIISLLARANNTIEVRTSHASGPDAHGSCSDSDRPGELCSTWRTERPLVISWPASETDRTVRGVAANWWNNALHVAFVNASGTIYRASYSLLLTGLESRGVARREAQNAVGEPELSTINVASAFGGGRSTALALIWRDRPSGQSRWSVSVAPDPEVLVDQGPMLTSSGQPVPALFTPTVVPFPFAGATTVGASACGTFVDPSRRIRMLCLDRGSPNLRWIDVSASALPETVEARERPGLAFQLVRRDNGLPLDGVNGWGQFWLSNWRPTDDSPEVHVSLGIDARWQLNPGNTPVFGHHTRLDGSLRLTENHGVTFLADNNLSALKGLYLQDHEVSGGIRQELNFLPFVDGTFDETLTSGNDFRVMLRGVCRSLRGEAFCGAASTSPYGL